MEADRGVMRAKASPTCERGLGTGSRVSLILNLNPNPNPTPKAQPRLFPLSPPLHY